MTAGAAAPVKGERYGRAVSSDDPLSWAAVFPVLRATFKVWQREAPPRGKGWVGIDEVNRELDRAPDDLQARMAVRALTTTGFLTAQTGAGRQQFFVITGISLDGLRLAANWPDSASNALDRLLDLLDAQIEASLAPDERKRWQRLKESLLEIPRQAAVRLLADGLFDAVERLPHHLPPHV